MIAVALLQLLMQLISTVMVGHLGEVALAGAAIANSLTNVSGFSVLVTRDACTNAYAGVVDDRKSNMRTSDMKRPVNLVKPHWSLDYFHVSYSLWLDFSFQQEYLQLLPALHKHHCYSYHSFSISLQFILVPLPFIPEQSIIVLLIVSVPIAIVWVFIPEVLPLIGQQPEIANEAGKYALWLIPGLFAFSVAQCFSKFLQCQSLIFPMVLSSMITLAVFIPLCWFLVYKVGMGNAGAALSVSICDWVEVIVLGLYIKFSPSCEKTRAPLTWEAFKGIGSFMRLAVPSALMICISTVVLLYNLPYGIGTAASVRVSNELGAGNPEGARLVVGVALSIVVCSAVLVSTTLLALRHFIGIAFSNEEEVVDYVTRMVPVLSISVITDSFQGVLSGVSRGCGWQHLGAYVNLGAFYLVGIPVALFFGFTMQLRGMGFWIGMIAGGATQVTLLSVITATTKWDKMVSSFSILKSVSYP
ncbi:unnamed protein product [Triticum turgidum subsp. durum]|uniref:Protein DETOXIFICATION n=1 Tax=Triticum turgidum subsp. durum TaxID=4567 RepID=A0A9R1NPV2_TRITD|nr:unnamed protein product [Triticum turgidum subsp. durum]